MKKEILNELNYITISFRDSEGNLFEGIDKNNFDELANRLQSLFESKKELNKLTDKIASQLI